MPRPLWDNPVYVNEMRIWRRQMAKRGRPIKAVLLGLCAVAITGLLGVASTSARSIPPHSGWDWLELLMVGLLISSVPAAHVIPTIAGSSAVVGERARQTLHSQIVTALTPFDLLVGKLLAAWTRTVAYLSCLLIPALIVTFATMWSSPSDWIEVAIAIGVLAASAWWLCAFGVLLSTLTSSIVYSRLGHRYRLAGVHWDSSCGGCDISILRLAVDPHRIRDCLAHYLDGDPRGSGCRHRYGRHVPTRNGQHYGVFAVPGAGSKSSRRLPLSLPLLPRGPTAGLSPRCWHSQLQSGRLRNTGVGLNGRQALLGLGAVE